MKWRRENQEEEKKEEVAEEEKEEEGEEVKKEKKEEVEEEVEDQRLPEAETPPGCSSLFFSSQTDKLSRFFAHSGFVFTIF